jgi:natural product biosynthesis luciferase-like monooxygenase protein
MTPDLSVMFFASDASAHDGYALVLEVAQLADELGFTAVWTPERHFHRFGGLFPNPAVLGAALAVRTSRLQIRAGSVVAPLHDPVRIAEEWAVVDNLSGGRVGVSLGSGWNAADFTLARGRYADRRRETVETLDTLRRLWRGERVSRTTGAGATIEIQSFPRPVSAQLPVWLTASGNPDTFRAAGRHGANVLTHLLGQDLAELSGKVKLYQEERAAMGLPPGVVSVMAHTFVAADDRAARSAVRQPLGAYLRDAVSLELAASAAGGAVSGGKPLKATTLPAAMLDQLVGERLDGICAGVSLIGGPEKCAAVLRQLSDAGVTEVACLVDFGLAADSVTASLRRLSVLAEQRLS